MLYKIENPSLPSEQLHTVLFIENINWENIGHLLFYFPLIGGQL